LPPQSKEALPSLPAFEHTLWALDWVVHRQAFVLLVSFCDIWEAGTPASGRIFERVLLGCGRVFPNYGRVLSNLERFFQNPERNPPEHGRFSKDFAVFSQIAPTFSEKADASVPVAGVFWEFANAFWKILGAISKFSPEIGRDFYFFAGCRAKRSRQRLPFLIFRAPAFWGLQAALIVGPVPFEIGLRAGHSRAVAGGTRLSGPWHERR